MWGSTVIGRLDRVANATMSALRLLPTAGETGHMPPGELAVGLSDIYGKHLGPCERLCLASAALMALDPEDHDSLLAAAQRDREPPWPFLGVGRKHRSPVLSAADKRRMATIPDFDDPDFEAKLGVGTIDQNKRALVRIWNGLSDGNRRKFLKRAASPADLRRALV